MLVTDIKLRVRHQFGDEASVQISDDDIFRWITDAQLEIVRQNQTLLEATALTDSIAAQDTYTLPSDLMTLHVIHYSGFRIRGMSIADFEQHIDGWAVKNAFPNGTPAVYNVWAGKFTLFPTPDISITDAIKIFYTKKPTPVASDVDTLSVPEQYHNAIVSFCLQQAYELDEDWNASNNKALQLQSDINNLRNQDQWVERMSYPSITTRDEDL